MDPTSPETRAELLSAPVYRIARSTPIVSSQDSLARAAILLRESPFTLLPFLEDGRLAGVITEAALVRSWFAGIDDSASASLAVEREFVSVAADETAERASQILGPSGRLEALVVDAFGRVVGIISPADFLPKPPEPVHPGIVGGMATPFGVYLTNGAIRAGASDLALVATGMLLFTLLFAANTVGSTLVGLLPANAPILAIDAVSYGVPVALFMVLLRLMPLAGIHAAEHQVVHAIERGEALNVTTVRRMPRVHPRCGTNIAAGLTLFLGLFSAPWIPFEDVRLLVAGMATLFFWRPLGSALQQYITTRPASDRQLAMGIRAGNELLEKFSRNRRYGTSALTRIWASGMLHVMLGSTICYGILMAVATLLGVDLNL